LDVGRRNVQGVLTVLYRAGFFPTAADLGGPSGRTIFFWPTSGKMRVRTLRGEEREY
jgi:chemotaxis receptor (MCP) glutamine deamidase CheD